MDAKSKIQWFEPIFFLFFGTMHTSRIWGFFDKKGYADAWLGLMYGKGIAYYLLMGCMAALCIMGMIVFIVNRGRNYRWRWVYVIGGGYVLFDLFAIATQLRFWQSLLLFMFDTESRYWYNIWGFFVLIGVLSLALGIYLCRQVYKQKTFSTNPNKEKRV